MKFFKISYSIPKREFQDISDFILLLTHPHLVSTDYCVYDRIWCRWQQKICIIYIPLYLSNNRLTLLLKKLKLHKRLEAAILQYKRYMLLRSEEWWNGSYCSGPHQHWSYVKYQDSAFILKTHKRTVKNSPCARINKWP